MSSSTDELWINQLGNRFAAMCSETFNRNKFSQNFADGEENICES